jgi:YfiH family protein|tara:strand:- start:1040 stop:1783 length:744 start_codon:yes stop_codon:yes gene_type:complete
MTSEIGFLDAVWPAPENIIAGTTLKMSGYSQGTYSAFNLGDHVGDNIDHVKNNRRLLCEVLNLPSEPCWLNQKHSAKVITEPTNDVNLFADASITRSAKKICVVLTADCLPVLITTKSGDTISAIHAGWRGLAAGIIENTINAMQSDPNELLVWLGPAISQRAFEVGDDVRNIFLKLNDNNKFFFKANDSNRWQADLYGLAKLKLSDLGIRAIFGGNECTYSDTKRLYSYRRDNKCGRMASIIYIQK